MRYIPSFNKYFHVRSSFMHNLYSPKIVHERDFCTGTCLEGDSAYPHYPSWMAQTTSSNPKSHSILLRACWSAGRSVIGRSIVFCNITPCIHHGSFTVLTLRQFTEAKVSLSFLSFTVSILVSAFTSLQAFFLPGTERRGLDRQWVTVSKNGCMCIYFCVFP